MILYGFYHNKSPLNHGNMFDILSQFSNHRRITSKFKRHKVRTLKEVHVLNKTMKCVYIYIYIYVDDNVLFVGETCW